MEGYSVKTIAELKYELDISANRHEVTPGGKDVFLTPLCRKSLCGSVEIFEHAGDKATQKSNDLSMKLRHLNNGITNQPM